MLMTEDMLLLTECPRIVDIERPVSDEIVDSGRGMISTFSEKPTRGRDAGLVGDPSRSEADADSSSLLAGSVAGRSTAGWSNGVDGKLELSLGVGSVGSIMFLTSWLDRAADRRCACPRLPAG